MWINLPIYFYYEPSRYSDHATSWVIRGFSPCKGDFSFFQITHTSYATAPLTPLSYSIRSESLPGVKRPGLALTIKAYLAPRLKKEYRYTSTPPFVPSWHVIRRTSPVFFFSLFNDDDINSDCTLPNKPTVGNYELQEKWNYRTTKLVRIIRVPAKIRSQDLPNTTKMRLRQFHCVTGLTPNDLMSGRYTRD